MNPLIIKDAISLRECADILEALKPVGWEPGTKTAGSIAASVKANWQANETDTLSLRSKVQKLLGDNELFGAAVMPTTIGLMFSRYEIGGYYGVHVDDGMMRGVRRDVSFTLFLTPPDEYEGGELIIETSPFDEFSYKGAAGSMIVYPATTLHQVKPITAGKDRIVVVGWARSLIRDPAQRELLFELILTRSSLHASHGKTHEVDLLSKTIANLTRMWAED